MLRSTFHLILIVAIMLTNAGLTGLESTTRGAGLALRAMPVAAGVVGDLDGVTGFTAQHMSSQRRTAALFDG